MTKIYYNFSLFDGISSKIQDNCFLKVTDGLIEKIGISPGEIPDNAINLGNRTVIPGLIDAHVHLISPFMPKINIKVMFSQHRQIKLNLENCIRSGVTTVRDMAATPGLLKKIMIWIEDGKTVGPRIIRANSMITAPNATPEHIPTLSLPLKIFMGGQPVERVTTPDKVREKVREMSNLGADWIKTTYTTKTMFLNKPDPPFLDDACFEALVDEARKLKRPVALHQTNTEGFRKGIELKVDSMEHIAMEELTDHDITNVVEAGIPVIPTIKVFRDCVLYKVADWMDGQGDTYLCPEALRQTGDLLKLYQKGITAGMAEKEYYFDIQKLEQQLPVMMENARRLNSSGAIIGCGTDSGGSHFSVFGKINDEIENLIELGMSTYDALCSATSVNARILGLEDKLGTLETGKLADFVVIDGNPISDIASLRNVCMVIIGGKIVYQIPTMANFNYE